MSKTKSLTARIAQKHDIESNWLLAADFIPMLGEIIIYDIDDNYNYERIKIGDGIQNVNALPFADKALRTELTEQINTALENHEVSWNDLNDKPFGTAEAIEITWNNDISAVDTKVVLREDQGNLIEYACHVSDKIPSDEQLKLCQYTQKYYSNYDGVWYEESEDTVDISAFPPEIADLMVQCNDDITVVNSGVYVVKKDNVVYNEHAYPKAGVYFVYNEQRGGNFHNAVITSSLRTPAVGIKQLDEKFIPDSIARVSDIPKGFSGSWNDLEDKPFGEGETNTVTINWDGDTSGKLSFDGVPPFGLTVYRVSDLVVSKADLEGAIFIHGQADDDLHEFVMSSNFVVEGNGYLYDEYGFIHVIDDGTDESGIYFASDMGRAYGRVYSMTLTTATPVKVLDEKFIPDTIARVSDIPSTEGLATEAYVDNAVAAMVDSAPETLNTLNELAAALGDDENFAATVTNQIAGKANVEHEHSWNDLNEKPFGETSTREMVASEVYSYPTGTVDLGIESFESGDYIFTIRNTSTNSVNEYNVVVAQNNTRVVRVQDHDGNGLICGISKANSGTIWDISYPNATSSMYLTIEKEISKIVTIDPKFIPDSIARVSDLESINEKIGDTPVSEQISEAVSQIKIVQPDWSQTDETAPDFIKNKLNENDALTIAVETELIDPIATASGGVLIDKNNIVIVF